MNTLLGIPLSLWGVVCLIVAVVYYRIWPKPNPKAAPRPMWMQFVLRWFHPAVWVALAGVCVLVYTNQMSLAEPLAYLALLIYATFMIVLLIDRGRSRKKHS